MMNETRTRSLLELDGGCLWSGVGAVLAILILVAVVTISAINRMGREMEQGSIQLTVVPYSTGTPTPKPADLIATETGSPTSTPVTGEIIYFSIGELVEVYGTEGGGLRLRNAPGLGSTINILALENEVFEVRGGPENVDGYVWWFLINPYDNEIQGWSVGNFLRGFGQ